MALATNKSDNTTKSMVSDTNERLNILSENCLNLLKNTGDFKVSGSQSPWYLKRPSWGEFEEILAELYHGPYSYGDIRDDENDDPEFLELVSAIYQQYPNWGYYVLPWTNGWFGQHRYPTVITRDTDDLLSIAQNKVSIHSCIDNGINYALSNFVVSRRNEDRKRDYEELKSTLKRFCTDIRLPLILEELSFFPYTVQSSRISDYGRKLFLTDRLSNKYIIQLKF